jgi:hypothetical protein
MSRKRNKRTESGQAEWSLNLEVVHPNAAGIDISNETHYVAVAPSRDPNPVRQFACFTEDLRRLADWLKSCGIDTVAMQSTGVYWVTGLRNPGGEGTRSVSGECTAYQEPAGT